MKNKAMKLLLGLFAAGALCMASCTDEEFTREAGRQPDPEAMAGLGAQIYRTGRIDSRVLLNYEDVTDKLRCRLSRPAPTDLRVSLAVDEDAVAGYNTRQGTSLELFPTQKVTLFHNATIAAGAEQTEDLEVTFEREGVEQGRYLLPVTVKIEGIAQELTYYYEVYVFEEKTYDQIDSWPFKIVVFADTGVVDPLILNQYFADCIDMMSGDEDKKTWIDIGVLGKSSIVLDESGRARLALAPDLQYVLNNREHYIVPTQKSGRKVLVGINNSATLGFCNLTDTQIEDLVADIGKMVADYRIDGVNFYDIDADYTKMAPVIPASYAKIIKATKEALDGKIVSILCDEQSTGLLSVSQEGIEAGRYLDFVCSGIMDEIVDAYAEGSKLKPIAGLDRSKYGPLIQQTHETSWMGEPPRYEFVADLTAFYQQKNGSANVFAFWDIPLSRSGLEQGVGAAFEIFLEGISDLECIDDCMLYVPSFSREIMGGYGKFAKDW